jgi:tetratricopeptide (TPR) repeat protein
LTTASDVYSLGVILGRLLPSAADRDLAAIVAKATEPNVRARYASADALAQDLEAFLAGRAVQAHNGSRWYRARKFVRQHKVATLGVLLLSLAIVAGTGAALWQASVAGAERDVARSALLEARQTSAQRAEVGGYLIDLFRADTAARGALTADDLLRRGVARANALQNQPVLQARMFDILGQMHQRIGRYTEAETLLTRAHALRMGALHPEHPDVAESLLHLARLYRGLSRPEEARRFAERGLRIRIASLPENDLRIAYALNDVSWYYGGPAQEELLRKALKIFTVADGDIRWQLGTMYGLATNLRRQGKPEATVEMARAALALAQRRLGASAPATGYAMIQLADQVRDIEQDPAEAEQLYREGLAIQTTHEGPNSMGLIHALSSLAVLMERKGDYAQAETFVRRVLALRMSVAGPQHIDVARTKSSLARILARQGHAREALQLANDVLTTVEHTVGRTHISYADALSDFAAVNAILGNWEAAIRFERDAQAHESSNKRYLNDAVSSRRLGRHLLEAGRFEEAEAQLLHSVHLMRDYHKNEDHPNVQTSKRALFDLYTRWGRSRDADRYRVPPPRIIEED